MENKLQKQDRSNKTAKLTKVIYVLSGLLGLQSKATPDILLLIAEYVAEYHRSTTPADLDRAVKMSISGQLDKFYPQRNGYAERNHYNQLSAEYFSKILNAYSEWKRLTTPPKQYIELPPSKEKEIAARKAINIRVLKCYENWKKTGRIEAIIPHVIHIGLVNLGLAEKAELSQDMLKSTFHALLNGANTNKYELAGIISTGINKDNERLVRMAAGRKTIASIRKSFEKIEEENINIEKQIRDENESIN